MTIVAADAAASDRVLSPRIEMASITKAFGSLVANDEVSITFEPSQVHAVLGENGAGKSTLMNILYGLLAPDSGSLCFDGQQHALRGPSDALHHGIGMVHQHFMLVPDLTIAQNVAIGTRQRGEKYNVRHLEAAVGEVADRYGFEIDPRAYVRDLGIEDRQHVEIIKLLYRGARTLILDEPTAALSDIQVNSLLSTISGLREAGHSVVMVTHKLDEVLAVADRATVMCAGRVVASHARGEFDEELLTRSMFADTPVTSRARGEVRIDADRRLTVNGLAARSSDGRERLKDFSITVQAGEIVGLAGVAGSGQAELFDVLAGLASPSSGSVEVDGRDVTGWNTARLRQHGLGFIPEDRHSAGLVLEMTVADNLSVAMPARARRNRFGLLRTRALQLRAESLVQDFDIRPPDPHQKVLNLSGGNQQKVVVARELASSPGVLIVASPTRGVDLRAAAAIYERIEEAAASGTAVLVMSPDLDEIFRLAHRVVVIHEGHDAASLDTTATSRDVVSRAMVRGRSADYDGGLA